jgi:zinc/manganese transport system ATP-binding protein
VGTEVARLAGAVLRLGGRRIWGGLSLEIAPGEFLAVIGPNGAGKTSLLRVLLGLCRLEAGTAEVLGRAPRRGDPAIGYVPQQRSFEPDMPMRGRDLVGLGVDGHRWGLALSGRERARRVDAALAAVGARDEAEAPIGRLSGGEQQRLRIAQAIVGEPRLLLCDEPLSSLDVRHQAGIVRLVADLNRSRRLPVVFVTHDINPLLGHADRVLCLARGRGVAGTPEAVLTSDALSRLYGAPVEVLRVRDQLVVLGADLGGHEAAAAGGDAG